MERLASTQAPQDNEPMKFQELAELSIEDRGKVQMLIASSVGNPTQDRLKALIDSYSAESNRDLFIVRIGEELVGCIGIKHKENHSLEILHIAVLEEFRMKGIGQALIDEIFRLFTPTELTAETDDEAVDFYRQSDFEILELFENESKVQRYRVRRKAIR